MTISRHFVFALTALFVFTFAFTGISSAEMKHDMKHDSSAEMKHDDMKKDSSKEMKHDMKHDSSAEMKHDMKHDSGGEMKHDDMKKETGKEMKHDKGAHKDHNPAAMMISPRGLKWMSFANNKLGSRLDGNLSFTNQDGKKVQLKDYFDKPFFITFIFADCPEVCPTINATMGGAVLAAREKYGDKFRTLTVSFDVENDSVERLKEYGQEYTDDFGFWTFGVAEKETVKTLTDAFGFSYKADKTIGWSHIALVSAVSKGGVITKQIFGMEVDADKVFEATEAMVQ